MDSKIKFKIILVVLIAIILVNLVILHSFPTTPPIHAIKPVKGISFFIDDVDDNIHNFGIPPEIIYYPNNETWILQEKEKYNKKIEKVDYIYPEASKIYYSYSPNITIEGSNINFNFGIRNNMEVDVLEVPLTIEIHIKKTRSSMIEGTLDEEISTTEKNIILNNFKDGEYREVRVTVDLIKPTENETFDEIIIIRTPPNIVSSNRSVVWQNEPRPTTGSAVFNIRSTNAYISVEKAIESIRKFTGKTDEAVEFRANESGRHVYLFQAENGRFLVSKLTGDVELATFNKASERSTNIRLSLEQAETIAKGYAEKKYRNFTQKNMRLIKAQLSERGEISEYAFMWSEVINNVETPNKVQISLNPNTGEIISYIGYNR